MGRPISNRKCSIEGCEKPHCSKGLCRSHYDKKLKEDPEYRAYLRDVRNRYKCRIEQINFNAPPQVVLKQMIVTAQKGKG